MIKANTHLGNRMLHRNKSVMIEGGAIPRARVMDQVMIDRYLMRGLLNLTQHRAGEFLMQQAARAGAWATGCDWSKPGGVGAGGSRGHVGSLAYGGTLAAVQDKLGWFHMWICREVVIHDYDASKSDFRMDCLRQGLDWIAHRRMGIRPMRLLRGG